MSMQYVNMCFVVMFFRFLSKQCRTMSDSFGLAGVWSQDRQMRRTRDERVARRM